MPDVAIKRFSNWLNNWKALLAVVGTILGGTALLAWEGFKIYNKVLYAETEIQVQRKSFSSKIENIIYEHKNDIESLNRRSDLRYDRAMLIAKEMKEKQEETENELEQHLIEDAYHRGKADAVLEILLKKH